MADLISRVYSNFRGVDFRGLEVNLLRSPDSLNMWKDYKETESIRTRPEFKKLWTYTSTVYGIFAYDGGRFLIHSGKTLIKRDSRGDTTLYSILEESPSQAFVYNNIFYILDGKNYLQYDGESVKAVEGYVPTTTIARKPMGGGQKYEDVNML